MAGVVGGESFGYVGGEADVVLGGVGDALEVVDVFHGGGSLARFVGSLLCFAQGARGAGVKTRPQGRRAVSQETAAGA